MPRFTVYPGTHYVTPRERLIGAVDQIREDLRERLQQLREAGKLLEAQRLEQRTMFDMEMIKEVGYCAGIENYSRYLSGRAAGEPPPCLFDYLPKNALLVVDESHQTIPQLGAMYRGDRSRKEVLVEYGFRLPSALDNLPAAQRAPRHRRESPDHPAARRHVPRRPLAQGGAGRVRLSPALGARQPAAEVRGVGAARAADDLRLGDAGRLRGRSTPARWSSSVVRPTGLVDPQVEVRPVGTQVDDVLSEIHKCVAQDERVLITTLTKRMAEDLTDYLHEHGVRVRYLHADIETVERTEIIRDLRLGKFDVLVGINLLREGLDMPEVSLVAILDADKEGFLRSDNSLIQTIGRAARNINGRAILYADRITGSMQRAIEETNRRRASRSNTTPPTASRRAASRRRSPTSWKARAAARRQALRSGSAGDGKRGEAAAAADLKPETLARQIKKLEAEMLKRARNLEFEEAARLRDEIERLKQLELGIA